MEEEQMVPEIRDQNSGIKTIKSTVKKKTNIVGFVTLVLPNIPFVKVSYLARP